MEGLRPVLPCESTVSDSLFPGQLINGDVINCYLRLIERRSLFYSELPRVFAFDTYFFEAWENAGYDFVKRRARNVNLFSKDILLFPLHSRTRDVEAGDQGVDHWALIVVKPKIQLIRALDSLGRPQRDHMKIVKDFLVAEAKSKKVLIHEELWLMCETPEETPRQANGVDCGVFTCFFAETISRDDSFTGIAVDTTLWRKPVARAIRRGKLSEEDFSLYEPANVMAGRGKAEDPGSPPNIEVLTVGAPPPEQPAVEFQDSQLDLGERRGHGMCFAVPEMEPDSNQDLDDFLIAAIDDALRDYQQPAEDVRAPSPCLSIAVSDGWELLGPTAVPVETPTEALVMPLSAPFLGEVIPDPGPEHNISDAPAAPRTQNVPPVERAQRPKRRRHPKRVRVYKPDGTFFRINIKKVPELRGDFYL